MQRIDHPVFVDMEVERVIWVGRVERVAVLRLFPADDLADVLDEGNDCGNVLHREHPLAVHTGAAGLDSAGRGGEGLLGHGLKIWYGESVWARVRPRMGVCACARETTGL